MKYKKFTPERTFASTSRPCPTGSPCSPDVQSTRLAPRRHTTRAQPLALNHRTRDRCWGPERVPRRRRRAFSYAVLESHWKTHSTRTPVTAATAALRLTGKAPAPRGDALTSRRRAEQEQPRLQRWRRPPSEPTWKFSVPPLLVPT